MKCTVKDCNITIELDISAMVGICVWCRKEFEPSWDDDDWFEEWEYQQGAKP